MSFDPELHEATAKLNSFRLARLELFEECMTMEDTGKISREQALEVFRHDLARIALERGMESQTHIVKGAE